MLLRVQHAAPIWAEMHFKENVTFLQLLAIDNSLNSAYSWERHHNSHLPTKEPASSVLYE